MTSDSNAAAKDNPPGRVQGKRARTRQQLIDAARCMLAANTLADASILELATAAGVSNGTFYNYFNTREELIEAVAMEMSAQLAQQLRAEFTGVDDPAERVVIAARTFMTKSSQEPVFGWALLRLMGALPLWSNTIRDSILLDVQEGVAKGRFRVHSEAAALDLVLGTLFAGIRTLLEQRENQDHIRRIGEISLVGLGMGLDEAQAVVDRLMR